MDKPRPEVVKVDLRVQVAKDDLKHRSHQLHLDMVLQAKTERQYSIPANTAGYHPVGANAQTLVFGHCSLKVPLYPSG